MSNKGYYEITTFGEGISQGWVLLTREEAMLFNRIADTKNWVHAEVDKWSGSTRIDLNSYVPEEWWSFHNNEIRRIEDEYLREKETDKASRMSRRSYIRTNIA